MRFFLWNFVAHIWLLAGNREWQHLGATLARSPQLTSMTKSKKTCRSPQLLRMHCSCMTACDNLHKLHQ